MNKEEGERRGGEEERRERGFTGRHDMREVLLRRRR
jgi:hypothetical protein